MLRSCFMLGFEVTFNFLGSSIEEVGSTEILSDAFQSSSVELFRALASLFAPAQRKHTTKVKNVEGNIIVIIIIMRMVSGKIIELIKRGLL